MINAWTDDSKSNCSIYINLYQIISSGYFLWHISTSTSYASSTLILLRLKLRSRLNGVSLLLCLWYKLSNFLYIYIYIYIYINNFKMEADSNLCFSNCGTNLKLLAIAWRSKMIKSGFLISSRKLWQLAHFKNVIGGHLEFQPTQELHIC